MISASVSCDNLQYMLICATGFLLSFPFFFLPVTPALSFHPSPFSSLFPFFLISLCFSLFYLPNFSSYPHSHYHYASQQEKCSGFMSLSSLLLSNKNNEQITELTSSGSRAISVLVHRDRFISIATPRIRIWKESSIWAKFFIISWN